MEFRASIHDKDIGISIHYHAQNGFRAHTVSYSVSARDFPLK